MNASQLINQTSGNTEYYTPPEIIEAARTCLGHIDLDPASCETANKYVGAGRYYTKFDDGLSYLWEAKTIWLNHPFGAPETACKPDCQEKKRKKRCQPGVGRRGYCITEDLPGNADWINALVASYRQGRVRSACNITFASTSEEWFQPLLVFPQCFIRGRVAYLDKNGTVTMAPPKGSVVTYLGPIDTYYRFRRAFEHLGAIKI